jgi:hypothetical protein
MLKALLILISLAVVVGLLFPATGRVTPADIAEARSRVSQLAAALKQYDTEYGKWPEYTGDGLFLDAARNAQLLRTLQGKDEVHYPRKLSFFEGKVAPKRPFGRLGGGSDPATGVFLDAWGNPYRIILDADHDGAVTNPYEGDPTVRARVIVWSFGKDGKQGVPGNERTFRGADDVLSWR